MIRMAVRKSDDLQSPRLGVFLNTQLLQRIEGIAVPWPVGDGIAHASEFGDRVLGAIGLADQRPAGLVGIASFEMLPHLVHHGPRHSQRQNFRR